MLFIHNEDNLERHHNDLDIYVNENQLLDSKQTIDESDNFEFISNMFKKYMNLIRIIDRDKQKKINIIHKKLG